jgi:serine/threonine protein kinase/tetratricopeptide (TPR) repeat protein
MREREIFMAAVDLSDSESRSAFLESECAGDPDLKARVEALLFSHRAAGSFLQGEPHSLATEARLHEARSEGPPGAEGSGTSIGPYKLLESIGEGGFGVVFMAEQIRPVRRKVALKIVKPGMDTRHVIARFEAERQALAIMDHPNIAKVLDGGVSPSGRPFFVMELIRGVPLTTYCDHHMLSARRRLELFIAVCHAVQHAHQKGIIHRDLKPSNILITELDAAPVVKIIDFGVAKALGQELTDKTLFTGFAQMIGTPLYMSPEQASQSGSDIDTRSDIYSLGVLLYELLTGTTPFDKDRFKKSAFDEICRIIRDEEPEKPSSRLSSSKHSLPSISAQRQTEPAKLTKLVRGDLDWIVMTALDKDRNRRYQTASGLAQDVQRYLADEPVQARPPTAGYRFGKFVRRNHRWLSMASVALAAFVVVVGCLGWVVRDRQLRAAMVNREVELALQESTAAEERALSKTGSPHEWESALAEASQAIRRAEGFAAANPLVLSPKVAARLREARALLEGDLRDRRFAAQVDEAHLAVSETYIDDGEYFGFNNEGALPTLREAFKTHYQIELGITPVEQSIEIIKNRPRPMQEILINALSYCNVGLPKGEQSARAWLKAIGQALDSDPWQQQAKLAIAQRNWPALDQLLTPEKASLEPAGRLLRLVSLIPAEEKTARLNTLRRIQFAHPSDFWATFSLGLAIHRTYVWEDAVRYLTAAVALRPSSPGAQVQLGIALRDSHRFEEAIERQREALRLDPTNPMCRRELGLNLRYLGRLDEAIAEFHEAIKLNPKSHAAYHLLANTLKRQGLLPQAEAAIRQAVRIKPGWANHHGMLGRILFEQSQFAESETELREAIRLHPQLLAYQFDLVNTLLAQGRDSEAAACSKNALTLKAESADAHMDLSFLYLCSPDKSLRDPAAALRHARVAIKITPQSETAWKALGWAQYLLGACGDSIESLEKSCSLHSNGHGEAGQWVVLALAHARLAAQTDMPKPDQAHHQQEFKRYYRQAKTAVENRWTGRPTELVHAGVWDFLKQAAELPCAKEVTQ